MIDLTELVGTVFPGLSALVIEDVAPSSATTGRGEPERLQRVPKYRPTLVDPYRDYLRKCRAEDPGVPVQYLLREIRERGYQAAPTSWSATSTKAASTATARTCHPGGLRASCSPGRTASPAARRKPAPALRPPAPR
jgi:hypothetical protein